MAEWEMNGGKSSSVSGASAMLVNHFMENAPRPIFITTADGTIEFTNRAAENMFGCNKSTFLGRNIRSAIPTLGGQSIEAGTEIECYIHGANGAKVPVSVATSEFEDASVQYYIHIFTDLTTQKTTEQRLKAMVSKLEESSTRLEQLVKTDPLTGLLNRRGLESVLIRELSLARRNGDEVVGIVIDLDNFKGINDTHGHAAGDLVLKTVSNILQDAVRTSDWVGRVGGDEFIVFLPSTSLEQGAQIAERIRSSVADSLIQKNGQLIKATTSLGVATLPYEVETLEQVLELTKSGLKSSKRRGKNTVSISAVQPPARSERGSTDSGTAGNWLTNCFSRLKQLYGGHGA
jgi:diguanylate cyclase (GGDEF)-like protein/PAS domain S-box-containing protein